MVTVLKWTGRESRALREAMRLSTRGFSGQLGVEERTVQKWEAKGAGAVLRPSSQAILDTKLRQVSGEERARFELFLGEAAPGGAGDAEDGAGPVSRRVVRCEGAVLRGWRRSRGWDAPEMARRLRVAAREAGLPAAEYEGLVRMVYGWERGDHGLTERYALLYARALGVGVDDLAEGVREVPAGPTLLSVLVRERRWRVFRTFEAQFRRAARELAEREQERELAKVAVSERTFERWYAGKVRTMPRSDASRVLEHMFGFPVERLLGPADVTGNENPGDGKPEVTGLPSGELESVMTPPAAARSQVGASFDPAGVADRISELVSWTEATNIGDGTLSYLDGAVMQLAHDCLTVSPLQTSERADALVNRIYDILRSGRQRLAQTRDLYVVAGKLCAILSWVSSDLGQLPVADAHARNGWILADQADHDGLRALLLSVQSKNDYWQRRYSDAAMHARCGYNYNPPGTLRVLLACQEADALQAMGKIDDAMQALTRSERTQEAIDQADELGGIFGCGIARKSNYSIATHLRAGSVDQALWHVERAETAWRDGEEWAYGTWAQVQIGAAIAHLMNSEIEGAAMILRQILEQPAERRLATLTTRLRREVTPLLASPAIGKSRPAVALRERIMDYDKSPIRQLTTGMEL